MCVSAYVWRPGRAIERCETIADLATALGGPLVLDQVGYGDAIKEILAAQRHCLCPVDIGATARKYGLRCLPPAYGLRTWHFDGWGLKDPTITARMPPRLPVPMKGEVATLPKSST